MTTLTEVAVDLASAHWDSAIIGLSLVALTLLLVLSGCIGRVLLWFEEYLE